MLGKRSGFSVCMFAERSPRDPHGDVREDTEAECSRQEWALQVRNERPSCKIQAAA